ncbi:MAG: efflux transporter outer membrane subunit [Candidatus Jidaibacter sp.]|jgi:multidrug efflux system outer membrane protein|nr:efflux transporter outer membrane subunit [Candidatus Jidaibacter sp.]
MGENYKRPEAGLPETWLHKTSQGKEDFYSIYGRDKWWKLFGDPVLDEIVESGLKSNHDFKIALYRIEASKAAFTSAQSSLFPDITAGFTSQSTQSSVNTRPPLSPGFPRDTYSHKGSFNLSYEIDFWGKIRRLSESAEASFFSTIYARENIRVSLISQIVGTYFDLRALQEQLLVGKRTVISRNADLKIRNTMFDAGTISMLELMQMKAEAFSVEAKVPEIELKIAQAETALSILIGSNPKKFDSSIPLYKVSRKTYPPALLPSEVLSNRPDVIASEQALIAANANLGAAKAAYFPSISLTGYAGSLSADLSKFGKSNSSIMNGTASALLPIFNAGDLAAQEDIRKAELEIAVLEYDKTIKNALKETEDSLISLEKYKSILHFNQEQVTALKSAKELAEQRYSNGISSYIEVLDAQRNLFQAELNLISGERQTIGSVISFIKAIGGGFQTSIIYQEYLGAPIDSSQELEAKSDEVNDEISETVVSESQTKQDESIDLFGVIKNALQ